MRAGIELAKHDENVDGSLHVSSKIILILLTFTWPCPFYDSLSFYFRLGKATKSKYA